MRSISTTFDEVVHTLKNVAHAHNDAFYVVDMSAVKNNDKRVFLPSTFTIPCETVPIIFFTL